MENAQNWKPFSITITFIGGIIIILLDQFLPIPLSWYKLMMVISGIGSLASLFIASKFTVYDHKFAKHPSSFIAQTIVKNKKNSKAGIIFLGFVIFLSILSFLSGNLFSYYYAHLKYTKIMASFFYIASICVIWMGSIQIDISRWGHLVGVLGMFIVYLTANISILVLLTNLALEGVVFSGLYYIFAIFEILTSSIYMITYFYDLKHKPSYWLQPGLHQKFWIIAYVVSMMAYGDLFSQNSFYLASFLSP